MKLILASCSLLPLLSHGDVLAHYSFDQDYSDSSANQRDGVLNDSETTGDSGITNAVGEFVFGGGAVHFSEERDFVEIPSHTFGTGLPYTIAFWAKKAPGDTGDPAQWDMVIGQRGGTNFFIALNDASGAGGRAGYRWRSNVSASGVRQGDYVTVNDNEWHHYAITAADDRVHTFYLDGVEQETREEIQTGFILDTIGEAYTDTRDFDFHGQIDEMWVFDETLSAQGVAGLFNANDHLWTGEPLKAVSILRNDQGEIEVSFSGLIAGRQYRLVRGSTLESFPVVVSEMVAAGGTEIFLDETPSVESSAFYRLEEVTSGGNE